MTPKVVHAAEPFIAASATALLNDCTGNVDLVRDYTAVLPNRVTVHLLGLDPADADQLARWAKELMESSFPAMNRTERGVGFAKAFPEFATYIDARIAERRAAPGDDVLSRLATLDVDGAPLPPEQVRALMRNLITGGLTTTSQLLGNMLYAILSDHELDARLRRDASALTTAIEESLRLAPPILFLARGCVDATSVAGCPVDAGQRVIIGAASANRDADVFEDADTFSVDRKNADQHLTFGYGAHVCPGATLARVVARLGVEAFFARFKEGTVRLADGFEFEQVPTYFEHGPRSLPIVVD